MNSMAFLWKEYPQTVTLFKSGSSPLELAEGDFILTNLYPDGIKIVKFYGVITEQGPRGFTYVPWNPKERRWASPPQSMRVDPRFIMCEPAGVGHYGMMISCDHIEKLPLPI
jgi:hypothetical protein